MRAQAPAISRRRLLAAAVVAIPAVGLARMITTQGVDAANINVTIVNFSFNPSPLTINQGDTVVWTNQDSTAHTVTSDAPRQFNSGPLQKGQTVQVTFNKVGTYTYHCSIHPNMHGTVNVVAGPPLAYDIAVVPGAPAPQPPPDFVQVPPPAPETVTTTAPPPPVQEAPPYSPPPVQQAPPVPQSPPAAPVQQAPPAAPPPPTPRPPSAPRTGEGGEAAFVRRLGDG